MAGLSSSTDAMEIDRPVPKHESVSVVVNGSSDSLVEVERAHIVAVLRRTHGVIEGPNGAAKLLQMKPSTARYRIKKLGIKKTDYLG